MLKKHQHTAPGIINPWCAPHYRQHFLNLFSRKQPPAVLRPGSLPPHEVQQQIEKIGPGKIVEIIRIGFDGELDDLPIIIEISEITPTGFSGKIVNVERDVIERNSRKKIYAKRGGGKISFDYSDGDIKAIQVSQDLEELQNARDIPGIVEMLSALEVEDRILVAYFDQKHRGTINVEGTLIAKAADTTDFELAIDKINNVELDNKFTQKFNIETDLVIDISIV